MTDQIDTQAYEALVDAVEPAPTIPVVAAPVAPRGRRSRLRWLVAAIVTVLVVGTAAGATLLLTASAGDAAVLAYVPADTVSYMEARLDLPGSQRAEVAKLLSAFPGFADQAALNTKLGEAFDRLVKAASKDKHDYQTEIAPWFSGELAVASGPTPATAATGSTDGMSSVSALASIRALVLVGVTDPAKATAWVKGILTETGATTADQAYNGATITVVSDKALDGSMVKVPEMGYTVLGRVLAAGDLTSLKAAVDTKGTTGLGSTAAFHQAKAAVAGDRVGFVWTDIKSSLASSLASLKRMDTDGTATAALNVLSGMVPAWSAGAIRAADGNLVIDGVSPHVALGSTAAGTGVAALAPKGTIALVGAGDLGAALTTLHDKLAAEPKLAAALKQVDTVLGLVGGFNSAVGWMGATGIAVTAQGTTVSGGVIVVPSDAAAAKRLFTQLRSLIELGTAASGTAAISDETYGDATITTVDLGALAPLLSAAAGSAGASDGSMPGIGSLPANVKLVYSVTDKVVVLGVDPAFVKAVLDARTGDSLAKDARFAALAKRAGVGNGGVTWLDITAIRGLAEGALPAASLSKYETDVKPYLVPLDAIVSGGSVGSDLDRTTMILSVNH